MPIRTDYQRVSFVIEKKPWKTLVVLYAHARCAVSELRLATDLPALQRSNKIQTIKFFCFLHSHYADWQLLYSSQIECKKQKNLISKPPYKRTSERYKPVAHFSPTLTKVCHAT